MKRKLCLIGIVGLSALVLTGCGGTKTLTCTKTETDNGLSMTTTATTKFDGNQVTNLSMKMDFETENEESIDLMKSLLEQQFEVYNSEKGITTEISAAGKIITIKIDIDPKNASDTVKEEFDVSDFHESYSKVKKDFEKDGYQCK